jgi:uncharacterized phage protein gp47/JayE
MPLSNTGFVADTQAEIVADLDAKILANVDPGLDLSPDQPFGQIIGIMAEKFAEIEELEATVYNALNPAAAEGVLLDNVAAISGTHRQLATYSQAAATVNLSASTTLLAGAVASVAGQPQNRWVLETTVTSTTAGNYPAQFRSEQAGPFVANAGTLTVIASPSPGWNSVTNATSAVVGLPTDSDTTLRLKRDEELTGLGSGDVDAIRASVLKVVGVIQAFVFENVSMSVDANGLPPKSFRVVIWDGASPLAANDQVAQAIWNAKPCGIQAFGTLSGTALDSQGVGHTVNFDRATQLPLYIQCTTTPPTTDLTAVGNIKAAFVAYGALVLNLGSSVIYRAWSAVPLEPTPTYTPIVTDVPIFYLNEGSFGTGTVNLGANNLQIYILTTSQIIVNGI